jgi:hypothetical protein
MHKASRAGHGNVLKPHVLTAAPATGTLSDFRARTMNKQTREGASVSAKPRRGYLGRRGVAAERKTPLSHIKPTGTW